MDEKGAGVRYRAEQEGLTGGLQTGWSHCRFYFDRLSNEWRYRRFRGHRLPDFLIIGSQKGGTTSLFDDLARHPDVVASKDKEVHYFDLNYEKGPNWYRSHFPKTSEGVAGEASPYYLFHPLVPERVKKLLPDCRLIVLLRNPVERAWSHYQMERRNGDEPLSFEEAIAREKERLEGEELKMVDDPWYDSFSHRHYSYIARGLYVVQLERWLRYFSKDQLLVSSSEHYFENPQAIYDKLTRFLNIHSHDPGEFASINKGEYSGLKAATSRRLAAFYRPYNERLYRLLGEDMGWA
jgi:Sulfotransferase domain